MTPLSNNMRDLANSGHERASELREKAEALDIAVGTVNENPYALNIKKMFGAWSRARRVWSECSGEPLI